MVVERTDGCEKFLPLGRFASATALVSPGRDPLTYRELGEWLPAARLGLSEAGVRRGEVAAVALPNGPELITAFLAIPAWERAPLLTLRSPKTNTAFTSPGWVRAR